MTAAREMVIGLETHVQLATRTKMFCGCEIAFGAPPNSRICPVCIGLPGALPTPNREAFRLAVRAGLALGCEIARFSRFDRKNYFYPDLPKGYQITQLDHPIVGRGRFELLLGGQGAITIVRAHLEEDAGKSIHDQGHGTLVDLNRCGTPLLEIVTAPEIRDPAVAVAYLEELALTLRAAGVSDCDMEKGNLRCDVNVSLRPAGSTDLGTKIEIKNLNSFRMVRRALEHEWQRQSAILDAEGRIPFEETRLWDDEAGVTRLMRSKEQSADYRYFPDPDLRALTIDEAWIDSVRAELPELPGARSRRYLEAFGLSEAERLLLVRERAVAEYFEELADLSGDAKAASNWVLGEVFAALKARDGSLDDFPLRPPVLARILGLMADGSVNVPSARALFQDLVDGPVEADRVRGRAEELGLIQVSDEGAIRDLVRAAIRANPQALADLRAGRRKAAGAIVGAVMRESKGRANPGMVNRLIDEIVNDDGSGNG